MRRRFWPRRRADQSAAVAIVGALGLVLVIASPGFGGRPPGDPALFAGDARLDRCGGTDAPVEYAFTILHARDYPTYLPAMDPTSVLDLDDPALIVIFRGRGLFSGIEPSPGPSSGSDASSLHDVCIYVGEAGAGELNFFTDVSIAGLRVRADGEPIVPAGP
jgi:hypothetical protein